MELIDKFKETLLSVVPLYLIVLLLNFTLVPLGNDGLLLFSVSTILIIVGLALFNLGVDNSIEKMGNITGNGILTRNSKLFLIIISFLVGFMVTFAEPDLQVLGNQVSMVTNGVISSLLLITVVSIGTGIFVSIAMLRIIFGIKLSKILGITYLVIFGLSLVVTFVQPTLLSVSFDSGGVTTGPMTVPFIMAIGIGVASKLASSSNQEDSFGAVGLASAGPILAMLILALVSSGVSIDSTSLNASLDHSGSLNVFSILISTLAYEFKNVFVALAPLVGIFFTLNYFFFKVKKSEIIDIARGLLLNYFGVVLFLTGVNAGFTQIAEMIGMGLAGLNSPLLVVLVGFILGLVIVFSEPAIWVLNRNVEEISGGFINRKLMMGSISISVGLAIALAMIRIIFGFSLWFYLVPGYLITFILMKKSPPLFTGIAFDSGGVSTGPMTATFILSFAIGVCYTLGGNILMDAFGLVAVVAMMPLIIIQLLGVIYSHKTATMAEKMEWLEGEKIDE